MFKPRASRDKGRAIAARPLLCLVLLSTALVLVGASTASAALLTPTLTKTNPVSPSASSTPLVKGVIEEAETKVVTFGDDPLGLIALGEDPSNLVRIYAAPNCTGTVVGEGMVSVLTDEGIAVAAVAPDSVTTFYAEQTDGLETSLCSEGLRYRQVSSAPDEPILTTASPPSPANENAPHLFGEADPEATIAIYANAGCTGAVLATGSGAQLGASGIQVSVTDNSKTTFSALATLAGFVSDCSGPLAYTEITPPPTPGSGGSGGGGVGPGTPVAPPAAPRLRTVPGGSANDNTPLLTGSAPGAATVRIYASESCDGPLVAKGSADELAAGLPVRVVDNDTIVFTAVSVAGAAVSKCSDPVVYVEDSLTPHTRITMGPAAKTAKRKAVIRFTDTTGSSPGTTFLCKVDSKKWKQCSSPLRLRKLRPRRYTVRVKAVDPAGNVEIKGARRGFRVIGRS